MNEEMNKFDHEVKNLVKKIGIEEPSADFTRNVMQEILLVTQNSESKSFEWKKWWYMIPLFMGIIVWGLIQYLPLTPYLNQWMNGIGNFMSSLAMGISSFIGKLESVKLPPIVIVSLLAAILLLTIDEILHKKTTDSSKILPKS